jgi:starch phosphorylase
MKTPEKTPSKKTTKTTAKIKTKVEASKAVKANKPSKDKASILAKLQPIEQALQNHLVFSSFKTNEAATARDWYDAASHTVRDHVVERWVKTAESYYRDDLKMVWRV